MNTFFKDSANRVKQQAENEVFKSHKGQLLARLSFIRMKYLREGVVYIRFLCLPDYADWRELKSLSYFGS